MTCFLNFETEPYSLFEYSKSNDEDIEFHNIHPNTLTFLFYRAAILADKASAIKVSIGFTVAFAVYMGIAIFPNWKILEVPESGTKECVLASNEEIYRTYLPVIDYVLYHLAPALIIFVVNGLIILKIYRQAALR